MSVADAQPASHATERVQPVAMPNLDWFLANFDELVAQYPGEWLAIVNQEVVGHSRSPVELGQQLRARGLTQVFLALADADALAAYK